jgi:RNA polymerase sigma factor (sigma-70 family)
MPSWLAFRPARRPDTRLLDSLRLVALCADAPQDSELWTEFLRRFSAKLRVFIASTLKQYVRGGTPTAESGILVEAAQEADLFQNTIVRLVENHCAALKRFSGSDESDFLAYLAVVARSTVRDYLRRHRAAKRWPGHDIVSTEEVSELSLADKRSDPARNIERQLLAREVVELSLRTIENESGSESVRDRLLFELYFAHDLSTAQIAQCKGIGLSKTGVEKALNRLKGRIRNAAAVPSTEAVKFG